MEIALGAKRFGAQRVALETADFHCKVHMSRHNDDLPHMVMLYMLFVALILHVIWEIENCMANGDCVDQTSNDATLTNKSYFTTWGKKERKKSPCHYSNDQLIAQLNISYAWRLNFKLKSTESLTVSSPKTVKSHSLHLDRGRKKKRQKTQFKWLKPRFRSILFGATYKFTFQHMCEL